MLPGVRKKIEGRKLSDRLANRSESIRDAYVYAGIGCFDLCDISCRPCENLPGTEGEVDMETAYRQDGAKMRRR